MFHTAISKPLAVQAMPGVVAARRLECFHESLVLREFAEKKLF